MGVQMAPVKLFLGGRVVSGKPCSPHPFPGRGSIPAGGQFLQEPGRGPGALGCQSGHWPETSKVPGGNRNGPTPGLLGGGGPAGKPGIQVPLSSPAFHPARREVYTEAGALEEDFWVADPGTSPVAGAPPWESKWSPLNCS